jgi:hypothetical protein
MAGASLRSVLLPLPDPRRVSLLGELATSEIVELVRSVDASLLWGLLGLGSLGVLVG